MAFQAEAECVREVREAVNFGERRGTDQADMLILHYTGMASADDALNWLTCAESGVSCHYFVFEDGRVVQLLPERVRAHHAGVSSWKGDRDINSRSIGIEIANAGHSVLPEMPLPPFPQPQMEAVRELCCDIIARNAIPHHHVLGHSDVAPRRKQDPGENFKWAWLATQGVGHWVNPVPTMSGRFFQRGDRGQPVEALQAMLALYGYEIDICGQFDEQTEVVVNAFQRHFRQERVDGIADQSTVETLHLLLSSMN